MKIKSAYMQFCYKKIGDGRNTLFWEDRWVGVKPLADQFPDLFNISLTKNISVARVFASNWSILKFRRDLVGDKFRSWHNMRKMCEPMILNDRPDRVLWSLNGNGVFTVKSFYNALKVHNLPKKRDVIWTLKIPLKVRVFLWLARKNKILTRDNLIKRAWKGGNTRCTFCGFDESVNHLFFECVVARFVWRVVKVCFNLGPFTDFDYVWQTWFTTLNKSTKKVVGVGLAAVFWSIWKCRNDAIFRGNLIKDPTVLISIICYWISSWSILQNSEERARRLELGVHLLGRLTSDFFSQRHGWTLMRNRLGIG
ncbi:hypothetical protein GUJ93_ZPchr0006g45670 [Zizania palustris]|uniref:Reverse transcriptase zinc-binding domain-containing protein n=1 Tax=Zizania palustris TaxID=103762 RepID=A0A8J5VUH4_ZIZPA|nr:hypothetical protein GUJ93_ZPchr0006g45670 [Zizania palustris]